MEGAVTPFHQHSVVFFRRQRGDHRLLLRVLVQSRPPHIIEQRPIFIALLIRLRGVKHRDALRFAVAAQVGDVLHYLFDQRAVFTPEIQKILLHVVDQQCSALRFHRPAHFVGRQFSLSRQRVIIKFWNGHDLFSLDLSQLLRLQALAQQFFIHFANRGERQRLNLYKAVG
ncbi:hypothetical protein D3C71_1426370 [compost metagenome]